MIDTKIIIILIYENKTIKKLQWKSMRTLESSRYKDYAWYVPCKINIAKLIYWKNYKKQEYYNQVNNMENSIYKDLVLFQIAFNYWNWKENEEALRGYTKGYVMYDESILRLIKLKAAQLNEKWKRKRCRSFVKNFITLIKT